MKLYTRKGDAGSTVLFGGQRIRKDDLRVCAYGTVDELNAILGWAAAACGDQTLAARIRDVQDDLFRVGAELATPAGSTASPVTVSVVDAEQVTQIERWIDEACESLPEIKTFILPAGSEAACRLHIARTVCRRAERLVVDLVATSAVRPGVLVYLNRLGDLLFAWARWANYLCGVNDVRWESGAKKRDGGKTRE